METETKLTTKQKAAFGIGAVGKDMACALTGAYVMYFYQDVLGLSAAFVGFVLMVARIFDALNDPFMGIVVAKTHSRWGRFRPWIFSGSVLNAFVLYALFAVPSLSQTKVMVYFAVIYILWGVTYTMMDIPYWSMIPAVAKTFSDRESLSVVGRTCAGFGNALILVFTMILVEFFGGNNEQLGFARVALLVAVVFAASEIICCLFFHENSCAEMKAAGIKDMFHALFRNDQALIIALTIILINCALYLTSNFMIYFFKYDVGGADWKTSYTLFTAIGGLAQREAMILESLVLTAAVRHTKDFPNR